VTSRLASLIYR